MRSPLQACTTSRNLRIAGNRFSANLAAYRLAIATAKFSAVVRKANFDPNQPRVPAGNPDGGQWTDSGSQRPGLLTPPKAPHRENTEEQRDEKLARIERERQETIKRTVLDGSVIGGFRLDATPEADPDFRPDALLVSPFARTLIRSYDDYIIEASEIYNVETDLIRSIMFVEITQGSYDIFASIFDINKSILPMNVNADVWSDILGSREDLKEPRNNIIAGAKLIDAITRNFDYRPSVAEIASLYNTLRTTIVTKYRTRVQKVYVERLWETRPRGTENDFYPSYP